MTNIQLLPCQDGDSSALIGSLVSLLIQPLPSLDIPTIPSFEDPFEDPKMEPLPFRQERSEACQLHHSHDQSANDLGQKQSVTDNPIVVVGNKRVSQDSASHHGDDSYGHQSLHSHDDDRVPRFRPYQDKKWKESFQRLLKYKNKFGHCCVPHLYAEDPALGRWVKRQRQEYQKLKSSGSRTSNLTTSRIEELESIGFVWHAHAVAWLQKVNELKQYKRKTGNCNVPSFYPENTALSTWVKSQRRQYKLLVSGLRSAMTTDRFRILNDMGFVFVRRPRLLKGHDCKWIHIYHLLLRK